jgi:hypothetical protein
MVEIISHKNKYTFSELNYANNEFDDILSLIEKVFGKSRMDTGFLKWQYLKNPIGFAIGYNAYHNGILVAHYATIPIVSRVFGKQLEKAVARSLVMNNGFN